MRTLRLVRGPRSAPGLQDDAGLAAAYDAHEGELYGFALRALGDHGLAEEAVQETFIRAWRAARRFDPALGTLRGWLFAICRRVVIDLARTRAALPVPGEVPDQAALSDDLDRMLSGWEVEEAMARLSPEHRQVVIAIHVDGQRASEVAARLGVPEGTVRSRLFYALRALRLALEEMGWDGA